MFSVDNFYEMIRSYYGFESTGTLPWIWRDVGEKNLGDMVCLIDRHTSENIRQNGKYLAYDAMILHDQEPFARELSLDIYRQREHILAKKIPMWIEMDERELFLQKWFSSGWPIFCHSEQNSKDIEWIKDIGCIPCHYFYHGFIARDWFRHWKHHGDFRQREIHQRFLCYIRDTSGPRSYRKKLMQDLSPLASSVRSTWAQDPIITADYSAKIVIQDAVQTGLHIVAETVFAESKIHLTEKIFKPMVMRQPFVVFAGAGALRYLRSYGFQTFGDIWDESYDNEPDADKRMSMILALIHDLNRLCDADFQLMLDRCTCIINHNHRHFFSQEFEDILLQELHANIQSALQEQKHRHQRDPGGSWFWVWNSMLNRGVQIGQARQDLHRRFLNYLGSHDPGRLHLIRQQYPWVACQ